MVAAKSPVPLQAVPVTYTKPVTSYRDVAVPQTEVYYTPKIVYETVQVPYGAKGNGGGDFGGGAYPGLGYGSYGGFGWSPLSIFTGFGSFGPIGWGGYHGIL